MTVTVEQGRSQYGHTTTTASNEEREKEREREREREEKDSQFSLTRKATKDSLVHRSSINHPYASIQHMQS